MWGSVYALKRLSVKNNANLDRHAEPCQILEAENRLIKGTPSLDDEIVLAKARAAALWCNHASSANQDKPWSYMLVPHDSILGNMTLAGLAAAYTFAELPPEKAALRV